MYVFTFYCLNHANLGNAAIVKLWNNETAGCWNQYVVLFEENLFVCDFLSWWWGLLHWHVDIPEQNGRFCASKQLLFLLTNEMTCSTFLYSICSYDQQDTTNIMIVIINNALHVSRVFCPSSGAYKLYEQPMVMACSSSCIQFFWCVVIIGFCVVVSGTMQIHIMNEMLWTLFHRKLHSVGTIFNRSGKLQVLIMQICRLWLVSKRWVKH